MSPARADCAPTIRAIFRTALTECKHARADEVIE
jgi:hypothetical protein